MFTRYRATYLSPILLLSLLAAMGCTQSETPSRSSTSPGGNAPEAAQPSRTSALLIQLPAGCNTPDAMALLPDGSVILSMPNFNDLKEGSWMMRITPDNQAEKFLELPNHPVTGQPVGPLGVCVAPSGDLFLADFQSEGQRQSRVLRIVMKDGKPTCTLATSQTARCTASSLTTRAA